MTIMIKKLSAFNMSFLLVFDIDNFLSIVPAKLHRHSILSLVAISPIINDLSFTEILLQPGKSQEQVKQAHLNQRIRSHALIIALDVVRAFVLRITALV